MTCFGCGGAEGGHRDWCVVSVGHRVEAASRRLSTLEANPDLRLAYMGRKLEAAEIRIAELEAALVDTRCYACVARENAQ